MSSFFKSMGQGREGQCQSVLLIETAKANGLEPYADLLYLFTELPKAETVEAI